MWKSGKDGGGKMNKYVDENGKTGQIGKVVKQKERKNCVKISKNERIPQLA